MVDQKVERNRHCLNCDSGIELLCSVGEFLSL